MPNFRVSRTDDVLIAVMGVTGSGKTTFISTLVEEDVGIGHGLNSATATSTVHGFLHPSGNQVQLIDTPGFNDTVVTDAEVLRNIAFILTQTYHRGMRLAGIIYLHRITDIRVSGSCKKMMKVIQDLVGAESFPRVVLTSTMWQNLADDPAAYETAVQREAELQYTEDFWGVMCQGGSKVMRWDGSWASALAMVDFLVSLQSKNGNAPLQIQNEMVDSKIELGDTKAGQTVNETINELTMKSRREKSMLNTKFQEAIALPEEQHDRGLAAMREECEKRISEAKRSQEKLQVDFQNLSKQKLGEYENMLQVVTQDMQETVQQRQMKELEIAEVDRAKSAIDESFQTEKEYNESQLKELEGKIEHLKAHGSPGALTSVLDEYKWRKGIYNEFLSQGEARAMENRLRRSKVAALRGEETRLGKMQMALQVFGVLMGVGITIAGGVTINPPLVGSGISLVGSSIGSIRQSRGNV